MAGDHICRGKVRRSGAGGPRPLARMAVGVGAGLLALGMLAGCGSSSVASSGDSSAAGTPTTSSAPSPSVSSSATTSAQSAMPKAAATIHISSFKYTVPATVAPGATVSVMNMDGENHTVTADKGNAFDVKATAGSTVTFVAPTKPGTYPFHCTYHSNMHGALIVK